MPESEAQFDEFADGPAAPWLPILDTLTDGVGLFTPHAWQLAYANPALVSWLGDESDRWLGRPLSEVFALLTSDDVLPAVDRFWNAVEEETSPSLELTATSPDGGEIRLQLRRVLIDGQGVLAMVVQRPPFAELTLSGEASGYADPLTGLPDRQFVMNRITSLLDSERSSDQLFAVLFIDLDGFKQVNDRHGHLIGDRVLREVACRMSACVRAEDHIARFGGDEFVVLLAGVDEPDDVEVVVERIHASLREPFELSGGDAFLSASIGVAFASPLHRTAEDVLEAADRAMYASKRACG